MRRFLTGLLCRIGQHAWTYEVTPSWVRDLCARCKTERMVRW